MELDKSSLEQLKPESLRAKVEEDSKLFKIHRLPRYANWKRDRPQKSLSVSSTLTLGTKQRKVDEGKMLQYSLSQKARIQVKHWWNILWIRKDEFHSSLDTDVYYLIAFPKRRDKYFQGLAKRRRLAHNRTSKKFQKKG